MLNLFLKTSAASLLLGGLASAAITVPGYLPDPSDGLFSYRVIDIDGTGTDTQVNSAEEGVTIVTTVGSTAAPGVVGAYGFSANDTGTISTMDNGATNRLYNIDQLDVTGYDGEDFVIEYSAGIYFPAGDYSLYANGDDGHSIVIPGVSFINRFGGVSGAPDANELLFSAPTGNSNQGAQFTIGAGGLVTTITSTWYERAGGDAFEVELRTGFGTKGTGADAEWDILREDADGSGIAINSTPFVAGSEQFQITEFIYTPDADEVTLTWNSVELAKYAVKYSRDMTNWDGDLDDSVDADAGEETTKTFDLVQPGLVGAGRVYFRVERLPPG